MPSSNGRLNDLLDWADDGRLSIRTSNTRSSGNRFSSRNNNINRDPPRNNNINRDPPRTSNSRKKDDNTNSYIFWIGIIVIVIIIVIIIFIIFNYKKDPEIKSQTVKQLNDQQHILTPARIQTSYPADRLTRNIHRPVSSSLNPAFNPNLRPTQPFRPTQPVNLSTPGNATIGTQDGKMGVWYVPNSGSRTESQ